MAGHNYSLDLAHYTTGNKPEHQRLREIFLGPSRIKKKQFAKLISKMEILTVVMT